MNQDMQADWGFSYTNSFQRQSCYASRNNLIGFVKPQWGVFLAEQQQAAAGQCEMQGVRQ